MRSTPEGSGGVVLTRMLRRGMPGKREPDVPVTACILPLPVGDIWEKGCSKYKLARLHVPFRF